MDNALVQKPAASSVVLKVGLLFGALEVINMLIEYYSGQMEQSKSWSGWILLAVDCVIAVMWIKKFRADQSGGFISFGKAFGMTLKSVLVSGVISVPVTFIFMHRLHPEIMEHIIKAAEAKLVANGTPDDQIELAMKVPAYMFSHPAVAVAIQIASCIIKGVVLGLVVAAIVKKERGEFETA